MNMEPARADNQGGDIWDFIDNGEISIASTEILSELENGDTDLMRDGVAGGAIVNPQDVKKVEEKAYPVEATRDPDPALHVNDLPVVLFAEIDRKGIAGHHVQSMNSFCKIGIKQILTKIFKIEVQRMKNLRDKTEEDRLIDYISFIVEFTDVNLTPPTTVKYRSGAQQMLTPNMARIKNLTYSAQLYVSFKVKAIAHLKNGKTIEREEKQDNFRIASIPVMIRSEVCNTFNCTRETLKELEEDPLNCGGSFIVKGGEWAVDNLENILINGFHVYKNQHLNEICRGEFISKPGDAYENSIYVILRYLNNGAITFQITTSKFDRLEIPFYLLFRAFGMTRDRDIMDHVVYGVDNDDPITSKMMAILEKSFHVSDANFDPIRRETDSSKIMSYIAQKMHDIASGSNYKKDDNAVKYLNNSTFIRLDKFIFPHIGTDPSLRIRKLRFLGHLINKLLRVELGVLDSTDRDSYSNKRVHTAGVSLAKAFKTQVNFIIVQEIRKHLIKDFKSTPFRQVQLVDSIRAAVNTNDLERVLVQVITSGNRTITVKRNEVTNRVSSQTVYHKNDLNLKSTLNTINTTNSSAAKQNERADEMRRVHPTYLGFIGITQSADTGEKVGMSKQMACSCSVSEAASSEAIKLALYEDPQFIPLDTVPRPSEISSQELTKVFVNGDWIGFCKDGSRMAYKYRNMRRHTDIHPYTTIVWEPLIRELKFWVDVGRLLRPLLIVYNNLEEFIRDFRAGKRDATFKQWIKLTKEHIRGLQEKTIDMEWLRRERIVEYISPEEQENAYVAPSYEVLLKSKNDPTNQFTHCDIELAIFGIVELSAPNTNHSPASRITMFTNQKKQTCGWFTLNWPYRIDKNTFLQYYCEVPLVKVFSDSITYPNGQNVIIAYQMYSGYNQEDSAILNKAAVDRGLFNGCFFRYEKSEIEKGEQFGNLDAARTVDIKKDANYNFVEDGFVREGTIVKRGDVLIVKAAKIPQPTDQYLYADKSTVYKYPEPSVVDKVIVTRNDEDTMIAKVKLRSERNIRVGDKISSRNGNKSIIAQIVPACDMPYAEDGLIPDIIINPHGIPTRMVIGQIMETTMGESAVQSGTFLGADAFRKVDMKAIVKALDENHGIKFGGHRRMYNGRTGNWFDTLIFVGPVGYQRLQKFVIDESYAVSTGPTSALTRQPLDGKINEGGLRVGEMEKDVYTANSCMRALHEKFYEHSDGIDIPICRVCGRRAIVNEKHALYRCRYCKDNADICMVPASWVSNIFYSEISAMSIEPRFELDPYWYSRPETDEKK